MVCKINFGHAGTICSDKIWLDIPSVCACLMCIVCGIDMASSVRRSAASTRRERFAIRRKRPQIQGDMTAMLSVLFHTALLSVNLFTKWWICAIATWNSCRKNYDFVSTKHHFELQMQHWVFSRRDGKVSRLSVLHRNIFKSDFPDNIGLLTFLFCSVRVVFCLIDWLGVVAQWLGRRSLAGGLSLIYTWFMVDMWPLCG